MPYFNQHTISQINLVDCEQSNDIRQTAEFKEFKKKVLVFINRRPANFRDFRENLKPAVRVRDFSYWLSLALDELQTEQKIKKTWGGHASFFQVIK